MIIFRRFFCVLCLLITLWNVHSQTAIFVSPSGSDRADGSLRHPLATVEKAILKARSVKGEATIYLRRGDYRITKTIVLTPDDGNDKKSLTIRPFGDETVTIKGSRELTGLHWTPCGNGIMKSAIYSRPVMDMLLVNGEIRCAARFPNFDPDAVRFNGTSAEATSPERIRSWKNPAGGYLHAMHSSDWGDFHYRITGIDSTEKDKPRLMLDGGWQNNRQMGIHRSNRMVENIFEELDAPGEWFYNADEATLYYYPLENENLETAIFETPQLKHLFELRGNDDRYIKNITIQGLNLTQTLRTFMEDYEPLLRSDWTVYRGGAILLDGAENCRITNCNLFNLGGNGVFFSRHCRHCSLEGSHLFNIGASVALFVGDPSAVRSPSFEYGESVDPENIDRAKGPKNESYPADCCVHDCLIHHIGLFEKQITGVEISMSRAITVSHCSIYDTPRAGINISEGTWGGHIIEHNDVFNTVRETGDHGSFNSWGRDRYWLPDGHAVDSLVANAGYDTLILADAVATTVIRNNRFRCDRGWDIDLDDGSTNYHIYNNLCLNGGLKLREGYYRTVENNILLNSTFHRHVWYRNNGNVFTRNIVMTPYPDPIGSEFAGRFIDLNIFADSLSLRTAQRFGTDSNSIVASIRFVNPAEGDFSIADGCTEVFRAGFQNFDMSNFGVVSPSLKALADKPQMPLPVVIDNIHNSEILTWEAVQIKNLETLGERSATGMDSERGVYVVAVEAYGSDLRDFLRSNDVVLGFAGHEVNSIADLRRAVATADLSKPQEMLIFRRQREQKITIPGGVISSAPQE